MQREELDEPLDLDDPVEPIEQVERPLDAPQSKRKLAWCREIMQEAKSHGSPSSTFRESKRPQRFASYVTQMSQISNAKPTTFEDAAQQQVWKDVMMKEYQSIMKNDVW
jgi:hypothetical protein